MIEREHNKLPCLVLTFSDVESEANQQRPGAAQTKESRSCLKVSS